MQANTIDEVIQYLDQIIAWSYQHKSRMGYFAGLYKRVTKEVKKGIEDGIFEHGFRMEKLDVVFANRYLEAFSNFRNQSQTTESWQLAFKTSKKRRPLVLQHLLMGMNAHINLDLGVAAAQIAPGDQLPALKNDFMQINQILASLINQVQRQLGKVWPALRLLDFAAWKTDEAIVNFAMSKARDHAWGIAEKLASLTDEERNKAIQEIDQRVKRIGYNVYWPGNLILLVTLLIRITEIGSVSKVIRILDA